MKKRIVILIALILIISISLYTINSLEENNNYEELTIEEFKTQVNESEELIIYVYSPKCAACKALQPKLDKVIKKYNISVKGLNIDKYIGSQFLSEENIKYTPTLLHYKNGEKVNKLIGNVSTDKLNNFFGKGIQSNGY
ncbi:thioredoxin family protein [Piscibacillus sp. B03]|uniref:thioredoxin family protein n=1 Tax=Piscibacillus sp. B03 TaxID=3457430 RepID=UPI003FCE1796